MCGVRPDPFTFGELHSMLEHRERSAWAHTSSLLAMAHSLVSKTPKSPSDFDPFAQADREAEKPKGIDAFRALLPADHPERNPQR